MMRTYFATAIVTLASLSGLASARAGIGEIAPPAIDGNVLAGKTCSTSHSRPNSLKETSLTLSGEGTETSPYQIGSADDWNAVASYMAADSATLTGKHARLTADIDFTGATISAWPEFDGTLDGNGKTIKGISTSLTAAYSAPLIVTAGENAYIYDFSVEGTLTANYSYTGTVVGVLYGKLSDVASDFTLTGAGSYCVSGIVGYAGAGSSLVGCTFSGSFTSSGYYSAGIVGYAYYSTISGCVNNAPITANYAESAGIVSYAVGCTVSDCVNNGSITGVGSYSYYYGGIVCWPQATTISGCVNNGAITEPNSTYGYSGGIAAVSDTLCVITGCANNGSLSFSGPYCGGIVGYDQYSSISRCANNGSVTAAGQFSGGVVGYIVDAALDSCSNSGAVSLSGKYSGGCAGRAVRTEVSQCVNDTAGSVTATGEYSAGVIGYALSSTISDCANHGSVTLSKLASAGVMGGMNSCDGYRCANSGTVNSAGQYGSGVVGSAQKSRLTDFVNESSAVVTVEKKNSSGVVGNATTDTLSGCVNKGSVIYTGTTAECYIGGLLGKCTSCVLSECANEGAVTATDTSATHIAGLIPTIASGTTLISGCRNTADITAYAYAGGLVAHCASGAVVSIADSYNAGDITAATSYAAGIVAYALTAGTVSACFNTGDISAATSYSGGIAGYSLSAFTDVYNSGAISGGDYIGGLIGATCAGSTSVATGYSSGTITSAGTCGNILGVSTGDTDFWSAGNSMSETYYLAANAVECADSYSVGLSYAEMARLVLGDGWTAGDNYTYPRITSLADNDYAKAYSAAVIPADGDSYSSVTTGFSVGAPDGVTWTASSGTVEIDGNDVTFSESYNGTLTMTATSGDVSVATLLTCDVEVSGVSSVTGASREVVSEEFYTISGSRAAAPADGARAIYIVVKTYQDGTTEALKELR